MNNLIVRIEAALNMSTGLITWRFTSIDPATGEPPEDPLAGFLPPNVEPPEGEGSVLFTVTSRQGLPSGTEISNQALITFDENAPLVAPEMGPWLNTVDNSPPTSQVLPLAETQSSGKFEVSWSGTDEHTAISAYTVFVSVDGGTVEPFVEGVGATSSIFRGENGRNYSFYSVATDSVGNIETKMPISETTTTVNLLPLDADQQKCINILNKDLSKVARIQGKELWKCLKNGAKGKLTNTIEECLIAPKEKVDKLKGKTVLHETKKCTRPPDFGITDSGTINDAAVQKELDLIHQLFGADLDAVVLPDDGDTRDGSKCQQAISKFMFKCQDMKLKEFNKCKKGMLKDKIEPADEGADLEPCMFVDPNGKVAKICVTKVAGQVQKHCAGVDLATAFPGIGVTDGGEFVTALDNVVACHACLALNTADALDRDCGEFCVIGSPSGAFLDVNSGVLD